MKTKKIIFGILGICGIFILLVITSTAPLPPVYAITDMQYDERGYVREITLSSGNTYYVCQKMPGLAVNDSVYLSRPFLSTSVWDGSPHIRLRKVR